MEVKTLWSVNNGCHMYQGVVIKLRVELYPTFSDSYSLYGYLSRVC